MYFNLHVNCDGPFEWRSERNNFVPLLFTLFHQFVNWFNIVKFHQMNGTKRVGRIHSGTNIDMI